MQGIISLCVKGNEELVSASTYLKLTVLFFSGKLVLRVVVVVLCHVWLTHRLYLTFSPFLRGLHKQNF